MNCSRGALKTSFRESLSPRLSRPSKRVDPLTNQVVEWETVTNTGERPRFGKAVENSYVALRRQQQVFLQKQPPNVRAAERYGKMADELEAAVNEWTASKYPRERWQHLSETVNKMNTPSVNDTLSRVGSEHLPEAEKLFRLNAEQVPSMWFSGSERVRELRNIIGEQKLGQYAEQYVSSQIGGKNATSALEWLKKNEWVNEVPALRSRVEAYAERMARFSNDRAEIDAVVKNTTSRINTIRSEIKTAVEGAKKTKAERLKAAGKTRDESIKAAEKEMQQRVKAADSLADFMAGKRPSQAMENFDKVSGAMREAGVSEQGITDVRKALEQAVKTEDVQERWRNVRRVMYVSLGVSGPVTNKVMGALGARNE
jgi:hypothetical protein